MNLDDRKVVELSLDEILPNRFQPRIKFSEDAINELAESIKEHGVIQPIVVRKINDKYEIIAGERRYKASVMAGKKKIPAILTDLNDKESAEIALIENVQREDLTPIEEAVSYKKILNMGYLTQGDLSTKLGKKQSTISNKLRLLNLDENVQEALLEKKISERHARSLLKLNNSDQQILLDRIIKERLTVRKTDDEIEKYIKNKNQVDQGIEILDIDDLKIKEGEKIMNNEMNNNFNIPTTPIIEDVPNTPIIAEPTPIIEETIAPVIEESTPIVEEKVAPIIEEVQPIIATPDTFSVPEIIEENNNIGIQPLTDPGFMDVDKIQNEATDINIEKPAIDLGSLLEPTKAVEEAKEIPVDASIFGVIPTEPITPIESTPQPEVKVGKFFDLDSLGEIEEATTAESIEKLLNASVEKEEPVEIKEETNEVQPEENRSEIFGINLEPKNPEFVENIEKETTNIDFEEPKVEIDNNNLNFDNFYTAETPASEPIAEEPTIQVETTTEPLEVKNEEIVEPVIEKPLPVNPPAYQVPSADELDSFLNDLDSSTPLSETVSDPDSERDTILETAGVTAAPTINVSNKMDDVVAIVREAKEKISALGINVNIDEFDFDDMYQAIIKIDK